MARYSNIFGGSMASCNINGRNISVINGEIYVDGIHYVPESESDGSHNPITPGITVEHKFDVPPNFNSIVAKGFMDVMFTQSDKDDDFEVKGMIPENMIERMNLYVERNTLFISMKSGYYDTIVTNGETPTIFITNKSLKDVSTSGSGGFSINGDLSAAEGGFSYRNSGSGDFKAGKIKTKRDITLSTSGSGDIELIGVESTIFMAHISGSADVDCGEVMSKICAIEIKGSGDVRISGITDSVDFTIAGSGDIDAGNMKAKSGNASVSGSGDIRCNVEHLSDRVRGSGEIHNRY